MHACMNEKPNSNMHGMVATSIQYTRLNKHAIQAKHAHYVFYFAKTMMTPKIHVLGLIHTHWLACMVFLTT